MYWLLAFEQAPAEVVTRIDLANQLPQFPANIADPQLSRLAVEAHLPRITQAVRPDFAASPVEFDERIIDGDRVGAVGLRPIDVDSQYRGQQVADVLPGVEAIGRKSGAGVTGRDIQHSVRTELQAAPVMPARLPGDDQFF